MDKYLNEVLELIVCEKISIRKAYEIYGYKRDFIRTKLVKKYAGNEEMLRKIVDIMSNNKANSTTINIDQSLLKEVFEEYLDGKILGKEACEKLGIKDKETLRNKFSEFVSNSGDDEMKQKYVEYQEKNNPDYSMINFRLVAIDMIRGGYSQTDMAKMLGGIHPRTISREFEKLKKDEDQLLYKLVKSYSDMQMKHHERTEYEIMYQNIMLNKYENDHEDLLIEPQKSKKETKKEEIEKIFWQVKMLEEKGLTQKQIAQELGISVSGIRRIKIAWKNQNIEEEVK